MSGYPANDGDQLRQLNKTDQRDWPPSSLALGITSVYLDLVLSIGKAPGPSNSEIGPGSVRTAYGRPLTRRGKPVAYSSAISTTVQPFALASTRALSSCPMESTDEICSAGTSALCSAVVTALLSASALIASSATSFSICERRVTVGAVESISCWVCRHPRPHASTSMVPQDQKAIRKVSARRTSPSTRCHQRPQVSQWLLNDGDAVISVQASVR